MTSIWQWLRGASPPQEASQPANDTGLDAALADMRARVRRDVASGFYGPADMIENAVAEAIDQASEDALRPWAARMVHEALAGRAAEQASWPATTDCDRLNAAFDELESGGIVMRHNFTCCGTCGSAEIWDEMEAFEASGGGTAYGYGFYHMQDTDSAVEGGSLYLNYGACEDGEEPAIATARAIVEALERHGLETAWDGSWNRRVGVTLDWKRRQRP